MSVITRQGANTQTIQVSGRFDFSVRNEFRQNSKQAVPHAKPIVVELSNVDYLDSSVLGILLMLRDKAINMIGARADVPKLLEFAHFDKLSTAS